MTAVAGTWRVNIRGVGSLKKRGTSSRARSFVKSSRACSLFESLIKEVAVSRLIFYAFSLFPVLSYVSSTYLPFLFFYFSFSFFFFLTELIPFEQFEE